jgi:hypothetical protein
LFLEAAMRRTTMLWEVSVSRFQEVFEQYEKHRLPGEEAGEGREQMDRSRQEVFPPAILKPKNDRSSGPLIPAN